MPTIAFWNTGGIARPEHVRSLAREWDVDVLILAENRTPHDEVLGTLNHESDRFYFPDAGQSNRLTLTARFSADAVSVVGDFYGVSIREYHTPLADKYLVVAVHLPSKLWTTTEEQILVATRLSRYVQEAEAQVGHSRTIVIGDLNMNPFEAGVVGSEGLHAVRDRRIVTADSRIVRGVRKRFLYNPMWSFLADNGDAAPGTYFYNSGTEVNYYWHVFDQVLFRPELLASIDPTGVRVVTQLNGESLLDESGRPDRESYSDHLPIVCRINEIEEPANVDQEPVG